MKTYCYACKRSSKSAICLDCQKLNIHLWRVQTEPYPYSFKPSLQRLASPSEISLGIELEYESNSIYSCRDITSSVNADFLFAYIKKDGSLNSRHSGEIVTVPASLEVHKYMWTNYFFNGNSAYKKFKIDVRPRTCGLHIHVGRGQLTFSQVAKMYSFLNFRHNEEFIRIVAGRRSDTYAATVGYDKYTYGYQHCRGIDCHGGPRRSALNLRPKDTIELRIFKATLAPWRLFARLEFAHALAMACAPGSGLKSCIRYEDFVDWTVDRKRDYPYLYKYFLAKNILVN